MVRFLACERGGRRAVKGQTVCAWGEGEAGGCAPSEGEIDVSNESEVGCVGAFGGEELKEGVCTLGGLRCRGRWERRARGGREER